MGRGRKPLSGENRLTDNVLFRIRNKELFDKVIKLAKVEHVSVGEIINRSLEKYWEEHDPGNSQTVLTSFQPEGKKSLGQIERMCFRYFLEYSTRFSEVKKTDLISWLAQGGVEPKKRSGSADKVIKALAEEGVKILSQGR